MNYTINFFESLMLIISCFLYFKSKKRINNNLVEIANLKNEIKKVKVSKSLSSLKNKRLYHRVLLENLDCKLEVVDFGTPSLKRLHNKIIEGEILNISAGGIGFLCQVDFPVTNTVVVNANFSLNEVTFNLPGIVVRKESHKGDKRLVYGIQFINIGTIELNKLSYLINNIELMKKTKK